MSRLRAVLAILLAVTWCSAVMHAELEAVGLMLDHEHRAQQTEGGDHPTRGGLDGEHEEVFARDLVKDGKIRPSPSSGLWLSLVSLLAIWGLSLRHCAVADEAIPICGEGDPPLARIWQFVQRCAPESAAPPALG